MQGVPAAAPAPSLGPRVNVTNAAALPPGTQVILKDGMNTTVPIPALLAANTPLQLPPLPAGLYSVELAGAPDRFSIFRHPGTEMIDV